jgi:RNA polymerase sigma factor (TIGR02999 family)
MTQGEITQLLKAHASGDPDALDELFPMVYENLRRMARRRMRRERTGHTLSTTALVHEAYLKLVDFDRIDWQDRNHFFALASRVMRNVLVDYAVKRKAEKRGGDRDRVPLREGDAVSEVNLGEVLAVHQALQRLQKVDERQVRVVECRFFGGLTIDETSEALGVSPATVGRGGNGSRPFSTRPRHGPPPSEPRFSGRPAPATSPCGRRCIPCCVLTRPPDRPIAFSNAWTQHFIIAPPKRA